MFADIGRKVLDALIGVVIIAVVDAVVDKIKN